MAEQSQNAGWVRTLGKLFSPGSRKAEPVEGVLAPDAFRNSLESECSRSDRIGMPLSLVVVDGQPEANPSGEVDSPRRALSALARLYADRIRCTDMIGWFDTDKLGILLPHTPAEAAWHVADHVHAELEEIVDAPAADALTYKVYACPFDVRAKRKYYQQTLLFGGYCPIRARPSRAE